VSGRFPIMRSLDPYHQRVGYLNALVLTCSRGLDMKEAIRARLKDLLFERLDPDDSRLRRALQSLSADRRRMLDRLRSTREAEDHPASILEPLGKPTEWVYTSELWLHQDCMPSPLGLVPASRIDRVLDLARWTGILTPTVELSETGYILQILLVQERQRGDSFFNPLIVSTRPAIRLLHLRLLLRAEVIWPTLVRELILRTDEGRPLKTRGEDGLLRAAVDSFLSEHGDVTDPQDLLEMREINEFRAVLSAKASTEENYLRPRLEILVDLELISRDLREPKKRGAFPWLATPRTRKLNEVWAQLDADANSVASYLDTGFFATMTEVYGGDSTPITDSRVILRWFARAFEIVGREIGFTPGRSAAVLACLLAFESGRVLEVSQVFDAVYAAASSELERFFRYSGGSRFDREFMINVDPAIISELDRSLEERPEEV